VRWLLRYIAMRRFTDGRLRTAITIIGIAAGVSSLIATGAANEAILKGFRSTLEAVGGDADISITTAVLGELPEDVADKAKTVKGVESASPAITEYAKLPDGTRLYVIGVDMAAGDDARGLNAFQQSGSESPDAMEFLNDPDAVLVSRRFADDQHLKVGDRFPVLAVAGRRDLHVRGLLEERGPAKAFGGQVGVMDIYTAEIIFARGKHFDRVDVKVSKGANVDDVITGLRAAIGPGPTIGRPERKGRATEKMLRSLQVGLYMGSMVSLTVGLFLVFNTMSFAVAQRRREIGTLRAIGVSRPAIAFLFTVEAAVYGAIGSAVGIGGGFLLARQTVKTALKGINTAYLSVNASDAHVPRSIIVLGLLMGVAGSVVAALVPAIEAAMVPPVDALRRDRMPRQEKVPTLPGRFLGLGIACLAIPLLRLPLVGDAPVWGNFAMGCINLGAAIAAPTAIDVIHRLLSPPISAIFGAPGRVALAGLVRARRRSGVAAGAVLIGISLVLCLDTFVASFRGALTTWIDHSIPADLFVTQGSATIGIANTPMDMRTGDIVRHVPGVAEIQPVRLVWTELLNEHTGIYGFDWAHYSQRAHPIFTDGDLASATPKILAGGVVMSDNFARRVHMHRGDHLSIPTAQGPQDVEIAGVMVDYSSDRGTVMMDRSTFIRMFHDELVDSFDTYVTPGADIDTVRKAIEKALPATGDAQVFSNGTLRKAVFQVIEDFFSLVYVLLAISVVVGVLGVVGTLLAQVLDRTRELGILRAMGASRGQILASVAIEAGLLALTGVLLGVPAGMFMGLCFVEVVGVQATGWVFPPVYPVVFALVTSLVSIAFASLGGLFPAERAARLDIVEAIGYE
jgi:putative ABC transport system permease protein